MKKIGIMQPYIFPYIGYFQLMKAVDMYVIYDDVQFIKGGWINRNNILTNGQRTLFSLALDGASSNKKICDIGIQNDFEKFRKTLTMSYAKAPYKDETLRIVDEILDYPDKENLAKFIGHSFTVIGEYIGIDTKLVYSSSLHKDNTLRGVDKVIAICKELKGTQYINAIGGQELYDKNVFKTNGLELFFLETNPIEYKQFKNEFVANLSIIDVMMFNSASEINKMLDAYELI